MLRLRGGRRLDARRRKIGNPPIPQIKCFASVTMFLLWKGIIFFMFCYFFFISRAKRRKIGNPIPQIKFFASVRLFLLWKGIIFLLFFHILWQANFSSFPTVNILFIIFRVKLCYIAWPFCSSSNFYLLRIYILCCRNFKLLHSGRPSTIENVSITANCIFVC